MELSFGHLKQHRPSNQKYRSKDNTITIGRFTNAVSSRLWRLWGSSCAQLLQAAASRPALGDHICWRCWWWRSKLINHQCSSPQGWSDVQHLERPESTDKIEQGWGFPWHWKGCCSTHSSSFTKFSKMMIDNPFLMITIATTSFTNRCAVLHFPSWSSAEFHDFMILWFPDDQ